MCSCMMVRGVFQQAGAAGTSCSCSGNRAEKIKYLSMPREQYTLSPVHPHRYAQHRQQRFQPADLLHHALVMLHLQAAAVAEVASIWNCKGSIAKTLLMHYMWDKDKLMSE